MTTLSNHYRPSVDGFERIDVVIYGVHRAIPTHQFLSGQVMRVNRPKPHEIKKVVPRLIDKGVTYELYIVRDACPVLYMGGLSCPLCGEIHA